MTPDELTSETTKSHRAAPVRVTASAAAWSDFFNSSKESSHRMVSELLRSCDCLAVDLVRAVVADGSASGREPPRVVLILTGRAVSA